VHKPKKQALASTAQNQAEQTKFLVITTTHNDIPGKACFRPALGNELGMEMGMGMEMEM